MASAVDDEKLMSFLSIANMQDIELASRYLVERGNNLEAALGAFLAGEPPAPALDGSVPAAAGQGAGGGRRGTRRRGGAAAASAHAGAGSGAAAYDLADDDGVRAPDEAKRMRLVDSGPRGDPYEMRSVVPRALRNLKEESVAKSLSGTQRLATLFRPPLDLIEDTDYDNAIASACLQKKWLFVNVQAEEIFPSHELNRDVWSNEAVKETIRANFVFWQVFRDTPHGKRYCKFYRPSKFPNLAIIDPRTKQKLWESGFLGARELMTEIAGFLDTHSLEAEGSGGGGGAGSGVGSGAASASTQGRALGDGLAMNGAEREEDELARAIAASLADGQGDGGSGKDSPGVVLVDSDGEGVVELIDSDSSGDESAERRAKRRKVAAVSDASAAAAPKPVEVLEATIPDTLPDEPDGKGVTKLQLRLGSGKPVVRRYRESDRVAALFVVAASALKRPHRLATREARIAAAVAGGQSEDDARAALPVPPADEEIDGFDLRERQPPNASLHDKADETLQEANLLRAAVLTHLPKTV